MRPPDGVSDPHITISFPDPDTYVAAQIDGDRAWITVWTPGKAGVSFYLPTTALIDLGGKIGQAVHEAGEPS